MRKKEYTIEEIRAIQKEEIHKLTLSYLWSGLWVALFIAMNFITFTLIAAAYNDDLIELKICAGMLNYFTCIGFYKGMKLTWENE